jgi:hypothetical protein
MGSRDRYAYCFPLVLLGFPILGWIAGMRSGTTCRHSAVMGPVLRIFVTAVAAFSRILVLADGNPELGRTIGGPLSAIGICPAAWMYFTL